MNTPRGGDEDGEPPMAAMVKPLRQIRDPPRGSPQSRPGLPHPGPGFAPEFSGYQSSRKHSIDFCLLNFAKFKKNMVPLVSNLSCLSTNNARLLSIFV